MQTKYNLKVYIKKAFNSKFHFTKNVKYFYYSSNLVYFIEVTYKFIINTVIRKHLPNKRKKGSKESNKFQHV